MTVGILLGITLLVGVRFERFFFRNNRGVVDSGQVYRSAQPGEELDQTIQDLGIASILNLRGGSRSDWWYANEVETCRRRQVDFYDLPISARRSPSRRELMSLIDVFDRARYPILIHCKSGADRTGLAAAVYRLLIRAESPARAETSFSYDYAHIPLFGPERLHRPIDTYARWLAWKRVPHTPDTFRYWAAFEYVADPEAETADAGQPFTPVVPGPRAEIAAARRAATSR